MQSNRIGRQLLSKRTIPSMELLPAEVKEIIFSYLPLPDLLLRASLVSKNWSEIIQRDSFLPGKKKYYKYLLGVSPLSNSLNKKFMTDLNNRLEEPESDTEENDDLDEPMIETTLPLLLDQMKELYPDEKSHQFSGLQFHPLFKRSQTVLRRRVTRFSDNFACVAVVMCLFAQDLDECLILFHVLMSSKALCNYPKVSELFYEIAVKFLLLERIWRTPKRLHYLLSHALLLSEHIEINIEENMECEMAESEMMKLSAEQRRVVNHKIDNSRNGTVRVIAFAGTGKTTTLKNLCQKNKNLKFLLVVFNSAIAEHARATFPDNVECRTANSLAMQYVKRVLNYSDSKINPRFEIKAYDLMNSGAIKSRGKGSGNIWQRSAQVLHTIREFCHSRDREITKHHVPQFWNNGNLREPISGAQQEFVYQDANVAWDEYITNPRKYFKIDHTIMLKLCQLASPNLKRVTNLDFDVLLMDESQDLNPAMLDICLMQNCPKFVVGDPHQQIYSFNGAINGLKEIEKFTEIEATYHLTQSFRFGPEIAFAATMVIQGMLGEKTKAVTCNGRKKDLISGCPKLKGEKGPKTVYLGRTNSRVFDELVGRICLTEEEDRPVIALPENMPIYYKSLQNIANLYLGNKSALSSLYDNFATFEGRMNSMNDVENIRKIQIVKKYKKDVLRYIDEILSASKSVSANGYDQPRRMDDPDVEAVFSTVHKFKGLECPRVFLLDDFYFGSLPNSSVMRTDSVGNDEINLLYVALTRAQEEIVMNDSLYYILLGLAKENFERVIGAESAQGKVCLCCRKVFEQSSEDCHRSIVTHQKQIVLSHDVEIIEGYLCEPCGTANYFETNDAMLCSKINDPRPVRNTRGLLLKTLLLGETRSRSVLIRTRNVRRTSYFRKKCDVFPDDDFDDLLRNLNEDYNLQ